MKVDINKLQEYLDNIQLSVDDFHSITDKVISENSSDLDSLMEDLKEAVTQQEAVSTDTLERYYAELTNLLYFMAARIERLGVYKDISNAAAKEAYNKAYLQYCAEKDEKGKSIRTVNENTALAETATQYESVTNTIYASAYSAIKMKVDSAQEMVSTLKNILRKRMNEAYLNAQISGLKNGLGELGEEV